MILLSGFQELRNFFHFHILDDANVELFVNFEDYVIQRYDWLEPCHGCPK